METEPLGQSAQAIRMAMIESLNAAGKTEQARMIARKMSTEFTKMGQELNLAKMDVGGAGARKIEAVIMDKQLERIGNRIPDGIVKTPPQAKARARIQNEAKKATKEITAEQMKIKTAQELLDDLIC